MIFVPSIAVAATQLPTAYQKGRLSLEMKHPLSFSNSPSVVVNK
jgi:hypothetical protein